MGAGGFWSSAAAQLFALCTMVLAAKVLLLAAYAALLARRGAGPLAEQDGEVAQPAAVSDRVGAARRADVEGLALFFVAGLLMLQLGSASERVAQLLFAPFTVASIFASWFQIAGLRRWWALNRGIGWICLLLMVGHVLVAVLRAG